MYCIVRDTTSLSVVVPAMLCSAAGSRTGVNGFAVGNDAGNFHHYLTLHHPSAWQHGLNYREEEDGHDGSRADVVGLG